MQTRQLYLLDVDTGRIRLTGAGVARYGARFARAGHTVENIRTLADLERAVDETFQKELGEINDDERLQALFLDTEPEGPDTP